MSIREQIIRFVLFEDETSVKFPWKIDADTIISGYLDQIEGGM